MRSSLAVILALCSPGVSVGVVAAPAETTIVACAPGYPGDTEQAQPSMDAFASLLQSAVGWEQRRIAAVYHEALDAGLQRLAAPDAAVALVPLPFYLEYREKLDLNARMLVEQEVGLSESWSLVVAKSAGRPPAGLAGWEVAGMPTYSDRFVRRVALAGWGPLSADTRLTFTSRVLSYLRKATRGESVAVLLDGAQTAAMDRLPFAADLEIIAQSRPVPTSVLCTIGERLPVDAWDRLSATLTELHDDAAGAEVLKELRLVRFHPLTAGELSAVESLFDEVSD